MKNLSKLNGAKALSKSEQKNVNGGRPAYVCNCSVLFLSTYCLRQCPERHEGII